MECSIFMALNNSSKEVCPYDLDDNFDELYSYVEIEDSIVVHCNMCYRTSHHQEVVLDVATLERSEGKAKGEVGSCCGQLSLDYIKFTPTLNFIITTLRCFHLHSVLFIIFPIQLITMQAVHKPPPFSSSSGCPVIFISVAC